MYTVVVISGVHKSDSVLYIYIYIYTHTHTHIHTYLYVYIFYSFFFLTDYDEILSRIPRAI